MEPRIKQCPVCGESVTGSASYCDHCGARIDESLAQADRHVGPGQGPQQPTGEVEVFERKGEGPGIRFGSFIVDVIAVGLISAIPVGLLALIPGSPEGGSGLENAATLLMYLIPPAIMFVYLVLLEGIFGTTVGKLLGASPWRLAVVRKDGTRCGLGRAALRALLLPFEANPLGAIVIWATAGNQRIGDLLAGTLVVDRRKPHKLTFLDTSAVLELVDGRRFEFAQIARGKIINWLQFHRMKIEGMAPDGRPVRLTLNFTREKYRMDRLRDELERAFQLQFVETIEWWRLIVIALMLCILVASAIGVALSVSPPTR